MKCRNCGADIPDGMLICPDCATEVQIVPDYNPLDDVLAREVKGSVEDATRPIRTDDIKRYRQKSEQKNMNSTRVLSQDELDRIRAERMRRARQNAADSESERRRQMAIRKKRARQKRIRLIAVLVLMVAAIGGLTAFLVYQNSYEGIMRRGNQALAGGNYQEAKTQFQRAVNKDAKKTAAYNGLAKIYIEEGEPEQAESMFLYAIDAQPKNKELYEALIAFYTDTGQSDKIAGLLEGCEQSVLEQLTEFTSEAPGFSLPEGTYAEVQEVALSGNGKIYYTEDGQEPTTDSTLYTEPILIGEGTKVIKAVAVNDKGIPSLTASATYTVDIPIADAPAVTPSTGQYNSPTQIVIQVPEGYTAYYTMDNTTPSAASTRYEGPIDMPEGRTFFAAVLVSDSGKTTQITKRNYILTTE